MSQYRHILLAVDLTSEQDPVAQRAAAFARLCGARLSLVHVMEHLPVDAGDGLLVPQDYALDQELRAHAKHILATLVNTLQIPDADIRLEYGSTKAEILRVANELAVDLIVVGSHGRHGLALLLGSTANAVLHGAPCDVLAVRIGARAP